jgi:ornithine carbamoyltransferase
MISLIQSSSVSYDDIKAIFTLADMRAQCNISGTAACSFQGLGTRTRTTFIKALKQLNIDYIDLPPFLDTDERTCDLAGYLDQYYDLYIIRHDEHDKLKAFADYSTKPVINAMSFFEHPCEALADIYWFRSHVKPLEEATIALWGPTTNVLRSWGNFARTVGATVLEVSDSSALKYVDSPVDLVVTDGWPAGSDYRDQDSLDLGYFEQLGYPLLLPTPPFTIGQEVGFDPLKYPGYVGYEQKTSLLTVQKAIICWLMKLTERNCHG